VLPSATNVLWDKKSRFDASWCSPTLPQFGGKLCIDTYMCMDIYVYICVCIYVYIYMYGNNFISNAAWVSTMLPHFDGVSYIHTHTHIYK